MSRLRRLRARVFGRVLQALRKLRYRALSDNRPTSRGVLLQQPLLCTGLGSITLDRCHIGVRPSPRLWDSYCHLEAREASASITIGEGVWLNNGAILIAERSAIRIGRGCLIGPGLQIYDSDFHHLDPALRMSGRHACAPVQLEENVFIGSSVTILKGVTVGRNSVVAAGSVVVSSVPEDSIAAGSPARVIRRLGAAEPAPASAVFLSIIVLTYNSATTVLETLDSLLRQGPLQLELVVCDDCSTDDTMAVVRGWLAQHGQHFTRVAVLESAHNQGICRNLARGYAAATGLWLKPIAGDDYLLPDAARSFADAQGLHQHGVVVAAARTFSVNDVGRQALGETIPNADDARLIGGDRARLLHTLYQRNPIPAPGYFIRRSALDDCGGLDMAFTHLDDWPLWIRMLQAGHSIGYLDQPLVAYRVATSSISTSRLATTINPRYLEDLCTFYTRYQKSHLSFWQRLDRFIEVLRWRLAKGPLRSHPRIYKLTRVLHLLSPQSWGRMIGAR